MKITDLSNARSQEGKEKKRNHADVVTSIVAQDRKFLFSH